MRTAPRLLVVEDDDAMRDLLCEELAEAGFEVTPARNGREGVERVRGAPFDLVITDRGAAPEQLAELSAAGPAVVLA